MLLCCCVAIALALAVVVVVLVVVVVVVVVVAVVALQPLQTSWDELPHVPKEQVGKVIECKIFNIFFLHPLPKCPFLERVVE